MRRNANYFGIGAALLLVAATALSRADDFSPPSWRLGNADATVQEWDFNTPTLPLAPDGSIWGSNGSGFVNPFGTPLLAATTNSPWQASLFGANGVYELQPNATVMDFTIPNDGDGPNHVKDIWIQITGEASGTVLGPNVNITATNFSASATLLSTTVTPGGWNHYLYSISLPFCPSSEQIHLSNNSPVFMHVDQVVVDTICNPVPEPASCATFLTGVVAWCVRRKRARTCS